MIPDAGTSAIPAGDLVVHGRVRPASNLTFLGEVEGVRVVYKPVVGEKPLWDFPDATSAPRQCRTISRPLTRRTR